jgi:menaquinol-cytochrome c reductase iron-sulfur subunit
MSTDLQTSKRFQSPKERRDFLGLASLWSAGIALVIGLVGALRLPVPAVFPESNSRVKLGPRQRFEGTSVTWFPEYRLWVYSTGGELYAISAICTHLGCTVAAQEGGGFYCPCHGSRFGPGGAVIAGPAPRALTHLALSLSPDGQVVVDQQEEVSPETRLKV